MEALPMKYPFIKPKNLDNSKNTLVVQQTSPTVDKLIEIFSRPEFQPNEDSVVLYAVAIDGHLVTCTSSGVESISVLPLFTEEGLVNDFIIKKGQDIDKKTILPYRALGLINAIPMFINNGIKQVMINTCPECNISCTFPIDTLKKPKDLLRLLTLDKAVRLDTCLRGLEKVQHCFAKNEYQQAGIILTELEKHNRLILPEIYLAYYICFSALNLEDEVKKTCQLLENIDHSWAIDLLNWWTRINNNEKNSIQFIPANQNYFGMNLYDLRAFSLSRTYLQPDDFFAFFYSRIYPDVQKVSQMKIKAPFKQKCQLNYPNNAQKILNGPLYFAPSTYFRWHVYYCDGVLYFVESYTSKLRIKLAITETKEEIIASEIEASAEIFSPDDPFVIGLADFVIKRHIFQLLAPHPFPAGITDDPSEMVNQTMYYFGSAGVFGTFADTTSLQTKELIDLQKPKL